MIDLGLSKLAIIGVVALIVIGPEKLPKVARMAGSLYGRAQRYLHEIKSEVSREIELDELKNIQKDIEEAAKSVKSGVEGAVSHELGAIENDWHVVPPQPLDPNGIARKSREFRRKKLVRSAAVPVWYKQRTGAKMHVISGAARVARFRPRAKPQTTFY
jgi:sec-independent protein translocase protein TatB